MRAELDVYTLREIKVRVELLLAYYSKIGELDRPIVHLLKDRLVTVSAALGRQAFLRRG